MVMQTNFTSVEKSEKYQHVKVYILVENKNGSYDTNQSVFNMI